MRRLRRRPWTWEGGTPVTVAPGDTLEIIARRLRCSVPSHHAGEQSSPARPRCYPGQHLVIPRYVNGAAAMLSAPATRVASNLPTDAGRRAEGPRIAPTGGVHVVAPGETLNSISRLYGKPVMVLARANNIRAEHAW